MQFAQANTQTKNCKRACFSNVDKNCFKKIFQRFKKIKILRHTTRQTQQTLTRKLNINKVYNSSVDRRPAGNKVLPQWGLTEVTEQLCFYQLLCIYSADELQNPPLRQYPKRCLLYRCDHH